MYFRGNVCARWAHGALGLPVTLPTKCPDLLSREPWKLNLFDFHTEPRQVLWFSLGFRGWANVPPIGAQV